MNKIIFSTFIILLCSCSHSSIPPVNDYPLLKESEQYFRKAISSKEPDKSEFFIRSALSLEQAAKDYNLDNGYLYYNAGNGWFKSGNIGRAILNYRKALNRLPSNNNIKNNLELARSEVENHIERIEANPIVKTLFFIHYDLSFQMRVISMIVLLFLTIACASILLFKKHKIIRNVQYILSIILLIFCISILIDIGSKEQGVIISPEVIARKGDSEGYDSSFTRPLTEGVEFSLLNERNGWFFIELSDGRTCWIPSDTASLID